MAHDPVVDFQNDDYDDNMKSAMDALFSNNRVRFKEVIDDMLADRAADAIEARKEEMATQIFDYGPQEDDVDEVEAEESDEVEEVEDEAE